MAQSRTSMLLKTNYQELAIDPDQVNDELYQLLKQKSSKFIMGGRSHNFTSEDPIFFRHGPIDESQ